MLVAAINRETGSPIRFAIKRGDETFILSATPERIQIPTSDGSTVERWLIGIQAREPPLIRLSPPDASLDAVRTPCTMIVRPFQ